LAGEQYPAPVDVVKPRDDGRLILAGGGPIFTAAPPPGPTERSVMTDFPKLTYERLQVGEEFVSDTFLVTPEEIETYAFAVDDHHPWFFEDSPFGGPVAHPTLLGNQALRLRHSRYTVPGGLHAKMEFEFVEPIRPGMRARSRGRVVDKYERRGKPYMVTEFTTEDERGTVLVRGRFTQMLFRD
jgi:acyl dehydratase